MTRYRVCLLAAAGDGEAVGSTEDVVVAMSAAEAEQLAVNAWETRSPI